MEDNKLKDQIEVMQAALDGKPIEMTEKGRNCWREVNPLNIFWNWQNYEYRIFETDKLGKMLTANATIGLGPAKAINVETCKQVIKERDAQNILLMRAWLEDNAERFVYYDNEEYDTEQLSISFKSYADKIFELPK